MDLLLLAILVTVPVAALAFDRARGATTLRRLAVGGGVAGLASGVLLTLELTSRHPDLSVSQALKVGTAAGIIVGVLVALVSLAWRPPTEGRARWATNVVAVLALLAAILILPFVTMLIDGAASQVPTDAVLPASREVVTPSGLRHRVDVYLTDTRWYLPGDEPEVVVRGALVNGSDSAVSIEEFCYPEVRGSLPLQRFLGDPGCGLVTRPLASGDSVVREVVGAVRAPPGRYTIVVILASPPAPEGAVDVEVVGQRQ